MARFSDVPTLGGSDCGILALIILRGKASNYSGLHWAGQTPKRRTIAYGGLYDHQGTFYGPGSRAPYSLELLGNLLFPGFTGHAQDCASGGRVFRGSICGGGTYAGARYSMNSAWAGNPQILAGLLRVW